MQALPDALAGTKGVDVRRGVEVRAIRSRPSGFAVDADGEALDADAVVVATEADVASRLLAGVAPEAAARLAELSVPPIAVVALGFESAALPDLPAGFGALIPRPEGIRHLGSLWDSHIFPGRAPDGRILVRVMFGGAVDPEAPSLDDAALVAVALEELRRYVRVEGKPLFTEIARWERAITQYDADHPARRRDVEARIAQVPGLYLAGTSLVGVGVPRAVEAGLAAGREAGERLRA
jgi:oxygen-dependent protoporphyrinogen oxidase